jgi:hypothetical protein
MDYSPPPSPKRMRTLAPQSSSLLSSQSEGPGGSDGPGGTRDPVRGTASSAPILPGFGGQGMFNYEDMEESVQRGARDLIDLERTGGPAGGQRRDPERAIQLRQDIWDPSIPPGSFAPVKLDDWGPGPGMSPTERIDSLEQIRTIVSRSDMFQQPEIRRALNPPHRTNTSTRVDFFVNLRDHNVATLTQLGSIIPKQLPIFAVHRDDMHTMFVEKPQYDIGSFSPLHPGSFLGRSRSPGAAPILLSLAMVNQYLLQQRMHPDLQSAAHVADVFRFVGYVDNAEITPRSQREGCVMVSCTTRGSVTSQAINIWAASKFSMVVSVNQGAHAAAGGGGSSGGDGEFDVVERGVDRMTALWLVPVRRVHAADSLKYWRYEPVISRTKHAPPMRRELVGSADVNGIKLSADRRWHGTPVYCGLVVDSPKRGKHELGKYGEVISRAIYSQEGTDYITDDVWDKIPQLPVVSM